MIGKPGMIGLGWLMLGALLATGAPLHLAAQDGDVRLQVSPALIDSGLIRFAMPRFSLKTGINIDLQPIGQNGIIKDSPGLAITDRPPDAPGDRLVRPVITDADGTVYYLIAPPEGSPPDAATRLAQWLTSETGRRTIEQFRIEGKQAYKAAEPEVAEVAQRAYEGDGVNGERLSYAHCGRCHVIGSRNRMQGIGSTPSFPALRALSDWQERFETFYMRNPHPALVQVSGITAPFRSALPPPIAPVEITQDDLEDILTYIAALAPADLGAPVKHQ